MDKNDLLRRAIDVLTAWATDNPDDTSFSGERLVDYISEGPEGEMEMMFGLLNLSGILLIRLEKATGRSMQWHLQDIAQKSLGDGY